MNDRVTRRFFLGAALALPLADAWPGDAVAQPTPACSSAKPTGPETEGPYFKPRSPERQSLLEPSVTGRRLILTGSVITMACRPVARALLDFWQADPAGQYDNAGFRLRGHRYTDADGLYRLETVVPGLYPGRTRHIHVKVQPLGGPVLTSQLYFPDEPANARDGLFRRELLVSVIEGADPLRTRFDFVISA
jgi:protocatechuate 3,4-dioxygenase beta subunit